MWCYLLWTRDLKTIWQGRIRNSGRYFKSYKYCADVHLHWKVYHFLGGTNLATNILMLINVHAKNICFYVLHHLSSEYDWYKVHWFYDSHGWGSSCTPCFRFGPLSNGADFEQRRSGFWETLCVILMTEKVSGTHVCVFLLYSTVCSLNTKVVVGLYKLYFMLAFGWRVVAAIVRHSEVNQAIKAWSF